MKKTFFCETAQIYQSHIYILDVPEIFQAQPRSGLPFSIFKFFFIDICKDLGNLRNMC